MIRFASTIPALVCRAVVTAAAVAALAGCFSIPEAHLLEGQGSHVEVQTTDSMCRAEFSEEGSYPAEHESTAGDGVIEFQLVNWNLYKGWKPGWEEDLERIIGDSDIVTLQEMVLPADGSRILQDRKWHWVFAPAFRYNGQTAGVLTASSTASGRACMLRVVEPLLRLPKSVLITRHPFPSQGSSLWVVNVHSINFTPGTDRFRRQWDRLMEILASTEGPLIVAGDFNTWSQKRLDIVLRATRRNGLAPVIFKKDARTTVFGHAVDHVFYRGLTPVEAVVYEVSSSDHHPMAVTFRWAP